MENNFSVDDSEHEQIMQKNRISKDIDLYSESRHKFDFNEYTDMLKSENRNDN